MAERPEPIRCPLCRHLLGERTADRILCRPGGRAIEVAGDARVTIRCEAPRCGGQWAGRTRRTVGAAS